MTGTPLERVEPLLLVAVGGALGAVSRYAVGLAVPTASLPWGTLVANTVGSFALGALLYGSLPGDTLCAEAQVLLGTGFLSSFTTYSAFAVETAGLTPRLALLNVGLHYALGLLAVVCGRQLVRVMAA